MRERIKSVLDRITSDRTLESEWLNTLSLMEFIGARKISKSVAESHPPVEVLDHLADETRHALAFKELANLVHGEPVDAYLCEDAARAYFFKLDRELSAWAAEMAGEESTELNYLLVTTMVERRAMMLYPLYRAASATDEVRDELSAILVEEQSHRVAIEARCLELLGEHGINDLIAPSTVESAFFIDFLGELEARVEQRDIKMSA